MKPINWPAPFHYREFKDINAFENESCFVLFNDGQELHGQLTSFFPEYNILEIMTPNGHTSKPKLQFVNYLRLVHSVTFKNKDGFIDVGHGLISEPPERQNCSVLFTNGQKLDGETIGFVIDKSGLYLFLAEASGTVIRYFIPTHAIKSYHIGDKIGQMLVKENIVMRKEIESGLKKQELLRAERLDEYLTDEKIVTPAQLVAAVKRQSGDYSRLGEVLVREKLITPEDLKEALSIQELDKKIPIGEIIVSMGLVDIDTIKLMLVKELGIPFIDVKNYNVDPNAVVRVPVTFVKKYNIMPLFCNDKLLIVAMENPTKWEPLSELRFLTNLVVVPVMATMKDILDVIKQFYSSSESALSINDIATSSTLLEVEVESSERNIEESDNTLVRLVNKVIVDAYQQHASDIHIETYAGKRNTHIRFRIDGTLIKYFEFPPNFKNALISRIKIMAKLDISEKRKPQDGKIEFMLSSDEKIELRVATVPTTNGLEDIVLRLLAGTKAIPLENIGLAADVLKIIKQLVTKPYGLFLVCGPTGSGKTTTLHSILELINTPDRKIWTAEDPIEITQNGLRQVQVNSRIGWTFATAMRSFLRADPDVIMVGEMRDAETAKISIEASLTGHMVFSTLHTNSATESMVRLLDFGMDPFNFSDALVGILGQRLVKRYCKHCKKSYPASADDINELAREYCLGTPLDPDAVYQHWRTTYADENGEFSLFSAKGCTLCGGTGFKGRIGLYEFLEASAPIKRMIRQQAAVDELLFAAINQGMHTLKQDGIKKILQGHTDIYQIRAVCN